MCLNEKYDGLLSRSRKRDHGHRWITVDRAMAALTTVVVVFCHPLENARVLQVETKSLWDRKWIAANKYIKSANDALLNEEKLYFHRTPPQAAYLSREWIGHISVSGSKPAKKRYRCRHKKMAIRCCLPPGSAPSVERSFFRDSVLQESRLPMNSTC